MDVLSDHAETGGISLGANSGHDTDHDGLAIGVRGKVLVMLDEGCFLCGQALDIGLITIGQGLTERKFKKMCDGLRLKNAIDLIGVVRLVLF